MGRNGKYCPTETHLFKRRDVSLEYFQQALQFLSNKHINTTKETCKDPRGRKIKHGKDIQ